MMGFLSWLVIVVCALALVVLLFPIRLKIEMNLDGKGGFVKFYLYRKVLWKLEKLRKKKDDDDSDSEKTEDGEWDSPADQDDSAPTYVAAPPRIATEKCEPSKKDVDSEKGVESVEDSRNDEEPAEKALNEEGPAENTRNDEEPAELPAKKAEPAAAKMDEPDEAKKVEDDEEKPEKRKLTDREFWNIILTPEFDERAFGYLKKILGDLFRLFCVRFEDCYIEGIRASYKTMGYGAALNGILKGYPYLEAWDLRMDWCGDTEFRIHGIVHANTNLCRILAFLIRIAGSALILYLVFRKRRKHVLETGELAELGFIRQKIVDFLAED